MKPKPIIIGGVVAIGVLGIFALYGGSILHNVSLLIQETFAPSGVGVLVEEFQIGERRSDIDVSKPGGSFTASLVESVGETYVEPELCERTGVPSRAVLINEVAWAGTSSKNTAHEWIELFNVGTNDVDLRGWQLINSDASVRIVFGAADSIGAQLHYILERKDNDTVPHVEADVLFSGTIRNTSESLTLFDAVCGLVDEVSAAPNWPGGEASPGYRTLERVSNLTWQTYAGSGSNGIFGTPKAKNSVPPIAYVTPQQGTEQSAQTEQQTQFPSQQIQTPPQQEPEPDPTLPPPDPEPASPPPPSPEPVGAPRVLVSEIMAGSEGNSNNEFIELYNVGNAPAELTGWSIKKKTSTGSEGSLVTSVRIEGKIIPPGKYFLIANDGGYAGAVTPDATWAKSNTLAYTSNSIILHDASGNIIEEVHWDEIPKDQSFMRMSWNTNTFQINSIPTPQNSL